MKVSRPISPILPLKLVAMATGSLSTGAPNAGGVG